MPEGFSHTGEPVKKTIILSALIGSFALIFAFVWMNRYDYEQKDLKIMRINRFTSELCYSQPDGTWNSQLHAPDEPTPKHPPAPTVKRFGDPVPGLENLGGEAIPGVENSTDPNHNGGRVNACK
jgi:hypothetical protein